MQAVTSKKQPAIWPVIVGALILAMVVAIVTTLDRQSDGVAVPTPVPVTFAVPQLEDGPVPGMPRDTFESITSAGQGLEKPIGMPDDTWQQISD